MESTDSSSCSQHPQLPPGFRFHPTDEELVVHYLKRKAASAPLPVTIIAEIDLYKFDPWELPSKATFGEHEWYFFSPRDRKYPNGARPNRAATSGYWKATGTDKPILTSDGGRKVGVKKALVFYGGKPPKGIKTNWIMHEYRLVDNNNNNKPPGAAGDSISKKGSLRLDDWVLCRIYKKNNSQRPMEMRDMKEDSVEGMLVALQARSQHRSSELPAAPVAPRPASYGSVLENEDNFFQGILTTATAAAAGADGIQLPSSSSSKLQPYISTAVALVPNGKRAVPSPHYWNNEAAGSTGKRFYGDLNNSGSSTTTTTTGTEENTSFVSLLNRLPQSTVAAAPFQPSTLLGSLGSLGDHASVLRQQFPLPSMNWNSS